MKALINNLTKWQPLRYVISGGLGAVTNLLTLFVLVEYFHLWYLFATVLAFFFAFGVSFTMQKFFTFTDYSKGKTKKQSGIYFVIQICNLLINALFMYIFVDVFYIHYLLSQIIIAGGIAVYSFFLFKNMVFSTDINYENTLCPSCDSVKSKKWGEKDGYTLVSCKGCNAVFVSMIPESTNSIYDKSYFVGGNEHGYTNYDRDKEPMHETFELYLKHIERVIGRKGRLLDIGCATGFFMEVAKNHGWEVEGIEISEYAAEVGRAKGLSIKTGTLENVSFPEKSFDVVTLLDVVEHLKDPKPVLTEVRKLLKGGGVVVVTSPDAGSIWARIWGSKWQLVVPPEHLILFNRSNFKELLTRLGLTTIMSTNIGKRFSLPYIFQTLFRWQRLSLWNYLARVTNKGRLSKLKIPINLHDNFFIIAKKQ